MKRDPLLEVSSKGGETPPHWAQKCAELKSQPCNVLKIEPVDFRVDMRQKVNRRKIPLVAPKCRGYSMPPVWRCSPFTVGGATIQNWILHLIFGAIIFGESKTKAPSPRMGTGQEGGNYGRSGNIRPVQLRQAGRGQYRCPDPGLHGVRQGQGPDRAGGIR